MRQKVLESNIISTSHCYGLFCYARFTTEIQRNKLCRDLDDERTASEQVEAALAVVGGALDYYASSGTLCCFHQRRPNATTKGRGGGLDYFTKYVDYYYYITYTKNMYK